MAFGLLLLAATQKGICAVRIGDSQRVLVDELKSEFNNAEITETDSKLSEWGQMLIDYLAGSSPWPKLPFDVKATAFNEKYGIVSERFPKGKQCPTVKLQPQSDNPKRPEQQRAHVQPIR